MGDSYSSFSFLSFGVFSSEALYSHYFFEGGSGLCVSPFYCSNSRFSIFGGRGVYGFNGDECLPLSGGSWEVVVSGGVGHGNLGGVFIRPLIG